MIRLIIWFWNRIQNPSIIMADISNSFRTRMHTQNNTNPKYKLLNSSSMGTMRENRQIMRAMEQQLQRSKLAVDNITTFRSTQNHLKKKIADIQTQLHSCMLKINSQNKKQKALVDLIAILNGEMFKFQTNQKHEQEQVTSTHQKKVKKLQYDIQQILQKHNQQIAKIGLLKEQANGCRSERVIYSNLFKKLQKEIKQNEQIYKEELLKTQATMMKKSKESVNLHDSFNSGGLISCAESSTVVSQKGENLPLIQLLHKASKSHGVQYYQPSLMQTEDRSGPFLTSYTGKDTVHSKTLSRKNIATNSGSDTMHSSTNKWYKNTNYRIGEYEREIEKLEVHGGCQSVEELLQHYATLYNQNQDLLMAIEEINNQIFDCKASNNKLQQTRKGNQFAARALRHSTYLHPFNQGNSQEKKQLIHAHNQHQDIVKQLLNIFDIHKQDDKITDDLFQKIDWKIDCISEEQSIKDRPVTAQEHTIVSEPMVECLIDRMDKFYDCEKILDRSSFQNQYFRELNRGKRSQKIKKNEK